MPPPTQALYKLHRLGGYGLAQEAAASRKPPTPKDELVKEGDSEDNASRAQFVAFALHSLTGGPLVEPFLTILSLKYLYLHDSVMAYPAWHSLEKRSF